MSQFKNIRMRSGSYLLYNYRNKIQNKDDSDIDSDGEFYGEIRELLTLPDTHICDVWAYNFEE